MAEKERKMKYTKSQLNAISRAKAERNQREALVELNAHGIDFTKWCQMFNYKASPTRLASAIRWNEPKTLSNLEQYRKETL